MTACFYTHKEAVASSSSTQMRANYPTDLLLALSLSKRLQRILEVSIVLKVFDAVLIQLLQVI